MQRATFDEPFKKFDNWLKMAQDNNKIIEPEAMCLSTVDENSAPSSRMILLKKYDEKGFCFFTNLTSRKGKEIMQNKNAALCFYWGVLGKQIRIEGVLEPVSPKEADDYFTTRRKESKIGAWASKQSCEMSDWSEFEARMQKITQDFEGQDISRPPFWSGFRLVPKKIEFWEEGDFRIHRREVYESDISEWIVKKIYP